MAEHTPPPDPNAPTNPYKLNAPIGVSPWDPPTPVPTPGPNPFFASSRPSSAGPIWDFNSLFVAFPSPHTRIPIPIPDSIFPSPCISNHEYFNIENLANHQTGNEFWDTWRQAWYKWHGHGNPADYEPQEEYDDEPEYERPADDASAKERKAVLNRNARLRTQWRTETEARRKRNWARLKKYIFGYKYREGFRERMKNMIWMPKLVGEDIQINWGGDDPQGHADKLWNEPDDLNLDAAQEPAQMLQYTILGGQDGTRERFTWNGIRGGVHSFPILDLDEEGSDSAKPRTHRHQKSAPMSFPVDIRRIRNLAVAEEPDSIATEAVYKDLMEDINESMGEPPIDRFEVVQTDKLNDDWLEQWRRDNYFTGSQMPTQDQIRRARECGERPLVYEYRAIVRIGQPQDRWYSDFEQTSIVYREKITDQEFQDNKLEYHEYVREWKDDTTRGSEGYFLINLDPRDVMVNGKPVGTGQIAGPLPDFAVVVAFGGQVGFWFGRDGLDYAPPIEDLDEDPPQFNDNFGNGDDDMPDRPDSDEEEEEEEEDPDAFIYDDLTGLKKPPPQDLPDDEPVKIRSRIPHKRKHLHRPKRSAGLSDNDRDESNKRQKFGYPLSKAESSERPAFQNRMSAEEDASERARLREECMRRGLPPVGSALEMERTIKDHDNPPPHSGRHTRPDCSSSTGSSSHRPPSPTRAPEDLLAINLRNQCVEMKIPPIGSVREMYSAIEARKMGVDDAYDPIPVNAERSRNFQERINKFEIQLQSKGLELNTLLYDLKQSTEEESVPVVTKIAEIRALIAKLEDFKRQLEQGQVPVQDTQLRRFGELKYSRKRLDLEVLRNAYAKLFAINSRLEDLRRLRDEYLNTLETDPNSEVARTAVMDGYESESQDLNTQKTKLINYINGLRQNSGPEVVQRIDVERERAEVAGIQAIRDGIQHGHVDEEFSERGPLERYVATTRESNRLLADPPLPLIPDPDYFWLARIRHQRRLEQTLSSKLHYARRHPNIPSRERSEHMREVRLLRDIHRAENNLYDTPSELKDQARRIAELDAYFDSPFVQNDQRQKNRVSRRRDKFLHKHPKFALQPAEPYQPPRNMDVDGPSELEAAPQPAASQPDEPQPTEDSPPIAVARTLEPTNRSGGQHLVQSNKQALGIRRAQWDLLDEIKKSINKYRGWGLKRWADKITRDQNVFNDTAAQYKELNNRSKVTADLLWQAATERDLRDKVIEADNRFRRTRSKKKPEYEEKLREAERDLKAVEKKHDVENNMPEDQGKTVERLLQQQQNGQQPQQLPPPTIQGEQPAQSQVQRLLASETRPLLRSKTLEAGRPGLKPIPLPDPATTRTNHPIIDFYNGFPESGVNQRTLETILKYPRSDLETVHDYIQLLFPVPERSRFEGSAPLMDQQALDTFRQSPHMVARMRNVLRIMLWFFGFTMIRKQTNGVWTVMIYANKENHAQPHKWMRQNDHNHSRMTRIIRSLRLVGMDLEAEAFWKALEDVCENLSRSKRPSNTSRAYWRAAANWPLNMVPSSGDLPANAHLIGEQFLRDFEERRKARSEMPSQGPSGIIDFFNNGRDPQGRTIEEILLLSNAQLNEDHAAWRMLFPLSEKVVDNQAEPVMDRSAFEAFHNDQNGMQTQMRTILKYILSHQYGVRMRWEVLDNAHNWVEATRGVNFVENSTRWRSFSNINHVRLAHIIRSIRLVGLESEAQELYNFLRKECTILTGIEKPSVRIFRLWANAVNRPVNQNIYLPESEVNEQSGPLFLQEYARRKAVEKREAQRLSQPNQLQLTGKPVDSSSAWPISGVPLDLDISDGGTHRIKGARKDQPQRNDQNQRSGNGRDQEGGGQGNGSGQDPGPSATSDPIEAIEATQQVAEPIYNVQQIPPEQTSPASGEPTGTSHLPFPLPQTGAGQTTRGTKKAGRRYGRGRGRHPSSSSSSSSSSEAGGPPPPPPGPPPGSPAGVPSAQTPKNHPSQPPASPAPVTKSQRPSSQSPETPEAVRLKKLEFDYRMQTWKDMKDFDWQAPIVPVDQDYLYKENGRVRGVIANDYYEGGHAYIPDVRSEEQKNNQDRDVVDENIDATNELIARLIVEGLLRSED